MVSSIDDVLTIGVSDAAALANARKPPVRASLSPLVGGGGSAYAFRAGSSIVLVEGVNKNDVGDGDVLRFVTAPLGKKARARGELVVESGVLAFVSGDEGEDDREALAARAKTVKRDRAATIKTEHGTTSLLVGVPKSRYRAFVETLADSAVGKLARLVIST